MRDILVSIITPCYNGENYVQRFIDSILNQNYSNIELIIVNDGSTDDTESIILKNKNSLIEKNIKLKYFKQENSGQASALNTGLKAATGEFILWMDSDDEISSDYISERVDYMRNHKDSVYCYGKSVWILEETGEIIGGTSARDYCNKNEFFEDILMIRNVFYPGFMVRTSALDAVINNRDIYCGNGGQNAQLLLPLAWKYGSPSYIAKSEYIYHVRQNSHSHSAKEGEKAIKQLDYYEQIVFNTLQSINDEGVWNFYKEATDKYSLDKFGIAIDSKNPELILEQYKNLKNKGLVSIKKWLLMMKYTNCVIRRILRV